MLKTETTQTMSKTLHKSATELNPQTILNQALQHPLLLAPPPTPTKHRAPPTDSDSESADPNSPHFPDHLGCGEVFTWHCEGEFYAVECRLCDDHPLCPLSEFPLHMEAWHTDWSGKLTIDGEDMDDDDDDEDQNDLYHVLALSPLNEDSGLCDYDHEHGFESGHQLSSSSSHEEEEEDGLEPFEQVLIEQDSTIGTTQINEEVAVDDGEGEGEDDVERGLVAAEGETAATTTVLIAAAASPSSSSSPNNVHDEQQPQQHHKSQSKQYNDINTNELSIQTLSPLNHSHDEESPNATAHEGESADIRGELSGELREYLDSVSSKECTLSESGDEPNKTIINALAEHEAEVTGCWVDMAKESCDVEKQEIPQTAGEMFDPKQQQDLQHFTISTNFEENVTVDPSNDDNGNGGVTSFIELAANLDKNFEENVTVDPSNDDNGNGGVTSFIELPANLDNTVEITSVEILSISPNVTDTSDATTTDSKRGRSSPRKRKCKETLEEAEARPEIAPPIQGKYLKSYKKFLEKTETDLEGTDSESISVMAESSHSSPTQCPEPKRRRIYSRACKRMPRDSIAEKKIEEVVEYENNAITSQDNEHSNESQSNCDTYKFLTPAYQPSTGTSSTSPEPSSSSSSKSGKIRYLVKQCERVAREHQSSASSTISSSSSSTTSPKRSTRRRRRSLTPVEVCDILPTVPLNDHSISIYDTGNMTPQTLSEHLESLACSLLDYDDFPDDDRSVASTTLTSENITESSPSSPKTEEEHFEFHEPREREKLNKTHVLRLIELYKEHTRLWDQTHTEFCEPQLCRQSWQDITDRWNVFCKRKFHMTEVRIRISTLCQRYLKERERIQREGELDESVKFPYFEQLMFLEQHRSLQKRREVYEQQNEKILDIFQKYLMLWHVRCYKIRQVKERNKAYQSISAELKEIGIYLSSTGVQKRIRSLKKCYRLEKIRRLHAQVERTKFEPTFKHYQRMQFLDKHIDPFVCRICSKIFESLVGFKEHVETANHGNILEEEDEDDEEAVDRPNLSAQDAVDAVLCGTNEKFEISMKAKDQNSVSVFIKPLAVAQEVEICSSETGRDTSSLSLLPMEDQIIEDIIENVSNAEDFATKTLDKYLHSGDSTEDVSFYIDSANNSITSMELNNEQMDDNQEDDLPTDDGASELKTLRQDLPKLNGRKKSNKTKAFGIDEEYHSGDGDTQSARLTDPEIHQMIAVYQKYRQLWDPNHLDYNSRSLRRQAWFALTTEYNSRIHRNFSWRSLYRKLIDYAKYYKKLTAEQNPNEIKWVFYKDLTFLDDVIAVSNELGKSIHQKETTLALIDIYRNLPQLWNIRDPDFNKRPVKQRNINTMCNRLQEETNKLINPERIKNRIIELRTQYRADKKKRLRCLKNKQKFFPDFEYYEEFNFIDAHIDPFECDLCCMDFKKLTDFNNHMRKEHEPKRRRLRQVTAEEHAAIERQDNVCHICGVKFSNRGNLGHHLVRHEGIRNFECSMCPKKFFTSHSLKIHVRTHTKECPYICEKCGLSFVNASKLNQHVLRHTNQKDFKCEHCPKAFYTAFERDRHTRWHLNIRDKDCPICGKSFVKGSSYYAHLMLHSDKKRFECDKCDMKFAQYAGLYKHKKRYHST